MFPGATVSQTHSPPHRWKAGKGWREREPVIHSQYSRARTDFWSPLGEVWPPVTPPNPSWPRHREFILAAVTEPSLTHLEQNIHYSYSLFSVVVWAHKQQLCSFTRRAASCFASLRCRGTVASGTCSPSRLRCSRGARVSCVTRRNCTDWRWSADWPRMAAACCRTTRAQRGRVRWDARQHLCN